jgi:hypothetical protein
MSIFVNQALDLLFTINNQDGNPLDISSATDLKGRLNFPDETTSIDIAGTLTTDGTDGGLTVKIPQGTMTQECVYRSQAFATIAGEPYPSSTISFTVKPELPAP